MKKNTKQSNKTSTKSMKQVAKTSKRTTRVNQLVTMEVRNLESDMIRDMSYSNGDLSITFRNGALYRYSNVKSETVIQFLQAKSMGRYFATNIKSLPFERLA
jgi:hypothetical protein